MQVPFDENGSLIRHPHRYPNADEIVWEDAKPFQAHLILHDVRNAQGYGKYVIWREAHGIRRFPMDTEHAFVVVKHTLMDHGSVIAKTTPTSLIHATASPRLRRIQDQARPQEVPGPRRRRRQPR